MLGSRLRSLELGRSGTGHVAHFECLSSVPEDQRSQTEDIAGKADFEGLELIRVWNSVKVSVIAFIPFALSMVFAGLWIGVSVGVYGVDTQVATQTAFTVAAFIVTAGEASPRHGFKYVVLTGVTGALLIALFAFLDSQARSSL